jgi:transcription initiation factor TFIIIB Brf1 subunit/transcription initiation factor TFIIB
MKMKGGKCPNCGSTMTIKEKVMGADTTDIVCLKCKYVGHWNEFHKDAGGNNSSKAEPHR